jgi:hypothetical protein
VQANRKPNPTPLVPWYGIDALKFRNVFQIVAPREADHQLIYSGYQKIARIIATDGDYLANGGDAIILNYGYTNNGGHTGQFFSITAVLKFAAAMEGKNDIKVIDLLTKCYSQLKDAVQRMSLCKTVKAFFYLLHTHGRRILLEFVTLSGNDW